MPQTTARRHATGTAPKCDSVALNRRLTLAEGESLKQWILLIDRCGMPPRIATVQQMANCKGYYCSHLGLPSGQPPDTPQTSVGHVLKARARSIQSPRSQRPYLLKDSSLSPIYPVPIVSLQHPVHKFPLYQYSSHRVRQICYPKTYQLALGIELY